MAIIEVNFMSRSFMRSVTCSVILPVDKFKTRPVDEFNFSKVEQKEIKEFKTLYLLHGVFGNHMDWISGTSIQRFAEERNLAIVMPAGENMAYLDNEEAHIMHGEFIGKELVEITRKMFPLSHKREDTFIGGLSMGGYGALRNGFKYHETFSHIIGLSSAIMSDLVKDMPKNGSSTVMDRRFMEFIFGDFAKVEESDKNPLWSLAELKKQGAEIPKVYMACGTNDPLLTLNQTFKEALIKEDVDVTYEEDLGGHDWDFWNRYIKKALDWLPWGNEISSGINSGNVL